MQIIRGTTPTIIVNVKSELDLTTIVNAWLYISQQNKVKIDKGFDDIVIDAENMTMTVILTQEDTLALKANQDALFQIRLLLSNETALATKASNVSVVEVYKGGVIDDGQQSNAD